MSSCVSTRFTLDSPIPPCYSNRLFINPKRSMLTPLDQAVRAFREANSVLLITGGDTHGDAIATLTALLLTGTKLNKEVTAISTTDVPSQLEFLSRSKDIQKSLPKSNDFLISLDISKTSVEQLSYKVEGKALEILITPKDEGTFREQDVKTRVLKNSYDLIMTINVHDLDQLGTLYSENTDMFFNTPIVNLDHHASNEGYGKINVVEIQAAATAQIVYRFIEALEKDQVNGAKFIDKEIATALLTGITAETESFQTYATTPEVFTIASQLCNAGANQQEIIRYLFKTKSLSALNLWGRVLARLKQSDDKKVVWSLLSHDDFVKSRANYHDIEGAMQELLATIPGSEILFVLYEKDGAVFGKIHTPKNINALELASQFENAHGHFEMADFSLNGKSLIEGEQYVLAHIQPVLKSA